LTTRCSSAFALIASCWVVVCAQTPAPTPFPAPTERARKNDSTVPALFPVQQVWTLALNNLVVAPTAYDGTRAFFSIEGDRLVAYDLISGAQAWLVSAHPLAAPAVGDGLLFILEAATLSARRSDDGAVAWQQPFDAKPAAPPVWDAGWLIVTTDAGEVRAHRAKDGELIWKRALNSPAYGRPALAADRVYVPTRDGHVHALRVDSGEPIWDRRIGGMAGDVLARQERIFAGSTENFLYCLLADNGEIDWRWRTGADIVGAAIADESRVYFVALDNVLRALNQKSGVQQWMRPLAVRPAWAPVAAGSTIVVAGLSPAVRGFAAKDGAPGGELTAAGEVTMQPHAFEDHEHRPMLLVTTRDIAKGGSAALSARSFEPQIMPLAPLPNLVQIAPTTPVAPLTPRP
jgi:outer membrane protein assembly factor BamB